MNSPCNKIHMVLRGENLAAEQHKKSKGHKWIRYEWDPFQLDVAHRLQAAGRWKPVDSMCPEGPE